MEIQTTIDKHKFKGNNGHTRPSRFNLESKTEPIVMLSKTKMLHSICSCFFYYS